MTLERPQPTLEEVAAVAGVSRATVSRVVNGSSRVSDAARAAVATAIEQIGYVPNRAARSLVTRRTDSVALVVAEPEARVFSEPFFAGVVRGVSGVLAEHDLQLVLLMAQTDDEHRRVQHYLAGGHVDGALLISLHADDPLPRTLAEAGLPLVVGGRPSDAQVDAYVDADNRGGARAAVEHLARNGRRRIATITGPLDMSVGVDRLSGYRDAVEAAGLVADPALVERGDFTQRGGEAAMRALLDRRPDLDAVFAASDLMALGALGVLRERGLAVPEAVAVVGFDDSSLATLADPPLTTVRQPVTDLGAEMARMLVRRIGGGDGTGPVIVPTELVLRRSA